MPIWRHPLKFQEETPPMAPAARFPMEPASKSRVPYVGTGLGISTGERRKKRRGRMCKSLPGLWGYGLVLALVLTFNGLAGAGRNSLTNRFRSFRAGVVDITAEGTGYLNPAQPPLN